jgi:hypothetical protein
MPHDRTIEPGDVAAVKRLLAGDALYEGTPVAAALALLEGYEHDKELHERGRLRLPENAPEPIKGHAVLIVDFCDDVMSPSGGHFIARNSWGDDWAKRCEAGPGHLLPGHLLVPYDYARNFLFEAAAGPAVPLAERDFPDPVEGAAWVSMILDREQRDVNGALLLPGTRVLRVGRAVCRDTPGNRRRLRLPGG